MECELPEDLLIYHPGAQAELSWLLGCASWTPDGGSGSSTDFQDTADNAETRPPAPADNAAAAAAADAAPHAPSLEAGSPPAAPNQQYGGSLPSIFSLGPGPPSQAAALITDTVAPAGQTPQQAATAAVQAPAAGHSPAGAAQSTSPPAARPAHTACAQQLAEQHTPGSSDRGADGGPAASAADPRPDSGKCHSGRKPSERPTQEHDDETGQEQSGRRSNTRDKQQERQREQVLLNIKHALLS